MTWAKLDDRFHHDPQMVRLERDARLVYVEVLTYCAGQLTDGFVADYMLRRITDSPDPDAAARALVDGGLWEPAERGRDKGWQVVGYLDPKGLAQSSREDVEKARTLSNETTKRSRLHKAGDHSECIEGRYCPQGQKKVTRHTSRQSSSQSGPLEITLSDSDPTPREGKSKERGAGATPPAPLGSQGRTPPPKKKKTGAFTVTMPPPKTCRHGLPWDDCCLECEAPGSAA